jgi:hypothetical protein
VAELPDPRREVMARMLSQGVSAVDAHKRAGFRTSRRKSGALDSSNASKVANEPGMVQRVQELRDADVSRVKPLHRMTGVEVIRHGIELAQAQDKPGEIIRAGIALAAQDGSFGELGPDLQDERKFPDSKLLEALARATGLDMTLLAPLLSKSSFSEPESNVIPIKGKA